MLSKKLLFFASEKKIALPKECFYKYRMQEKKLGGHRACF